MESKCPVMHNHGSKANQSPQKLNLKVLNPANHKAHVNYAKEFAKLDLDEVKKDIFAVMTTSQDWWPADYGHYGPFFIRMAWHSAGTYRSSDGRGGANTGNQRFSPLDSWPDNGNLDKARRLLWPVKKKYGKKLSWGDLMIFAGNCAIESMGGKPFGFAGGRVDIWEPETDVYWGPETVMLAAERYMSDTPRGDGDADKLEQPLAAVQMGLIYVNPQGPGGNPDPLKSAHDIRVTFGRMAMNDEETVALIAGGHTFGKAHGAAPDSHLGPSPEDAPIEQQGFGWKNSYKSGKGADAITSGLEGAWTNNPAKWDYGYFENLFKYEYELTKSPAGAHQWVPKDGAGKEDVIDAHDSKTRHAPVMFTTDLALKMDPAYAKISKRFHENPKEFEDAWDRAWYKLTHRDMGPVTRCLGKYVAPVQIWQDPVPEAKAAALTPEQVAELKEKILSSGLSVAQLVRTAWASASTHRVTDFRGGANGARIALAPQKDWKCNDPAELAKVLDQLRAVRTAFGDDKVSLADLIVLGGCAAVESAAKKGGVEVAVPFSAGRTDATQEQTDAESFDVLEPKAFEPFRNYLPCPSGQVKALVDKAHMLSLTAPEMAVLVAGLRVLNANAGGSQLGVFTDKPETLTNDFFVNLLELGTSWSLEEGSKVVYEGKDLTSGQVKWKASQVDLIFGSNSELRAISEYYASDDAREEFVHDFVQAWNKVMNLDRFDLSK